MTSKTVPGEGVDLVGNPVIDPTKNVLDLVKAESKYQDGMREKDLFYTNAMRDAETRRLDQLAAQKQVFDLAMKDVLLAKIDGALLLITSQLRDTKNDLSARVTEQEQFRWESGGQASVADPALAKTLTALTEATNNLRTGESRAEGRIEGRAALWIAIGAFVTAFVGVAGVVATYLAGGQ